jgi:large subunit ribosomal protein L21
MIAIIKTGGKQYIVSPGSKVKVEKLEQKAGEKVQFEEVLLLEDENNLFLLGTPFVEGAVVTGEVLEEGMGDKKIIFKYKPKKRYKLKKGHRQPYTEVEIKEISAKAKRVEKAEKTEKAE